MSLITTITRMWLTRTTKPFTFLNEYDKNLDYKNTKNLGLYIHIPFCKSICSFCPYCKEKYDEQKCNRYIDYLIKEIELVGKQNGEKKEVTSLYFGGGTPVLAINRLEEIINTVNKYFVITEGIGIELHPDNVTEENLLLLKKSGVSKISIGIQSFNRKFLDILGRDGTDYAKMFSALKKVKIDTVSMDFIFALPGQTVKDLKSDIDIAFENGANHIAIYPFIDFSFTSSKIVQLNKKDKRKMLDEITLYCESKGYSRNSIWTFSSEKSAFYSSMTRDNFLGFGCSATSLLENQFKINTFSIEEYIGRIKNNSLATSLTIRFTKRQRMIYYLFWTAYSTKVNSEDFKNFFGVELKKMYGMELWLAKKLGFVTEKDGVYTMTLKGAFYYHYYENFYTLSYIDKMWGIMRKNAFPEKIEF